jgi:hypothetical protein
VRARRDTSLRRLPFGQCPRPSVRTVCMLFIGESAAEYAARFWLVRFASCFLQ